MTDTAASASQPALVRNELNLVWLDMEMTGLDPDNDRIIEIAVVVIIPRSTSPSKAPCSRSTRATKRSRRWMTGTSRRTAARA